MTDDSDARDAPRRLRARLKAVRRVLLSCVNWLVRRIENLGGISRQGVVATSRWVQDHPIPTASQQALWLVPASALIGVGVVSLDAAGLGLSPFDVWLSGLSDITPLSFGQSAWVTSGVLFVVAAAFGVRPTSRSVLFIVLNGLSIDLVGSVVVAPDSIGVRIGLAAGGWLALVCGVALVVAKGAAGGGFEALMHVAERRGHRPLLLRTVLEVGFFIVGIAIGGSFGPMTIVIALSMGPAIMSGLQAIEDHRIGRESRLSGSGSPTAESSPPPSAQ